MTNDTELKRKRGTVLAAMNDLATKAGVSRARIYVWLKATLGVEEIRIGGLGSDECETILTAILKEMETKYEGLLAGVKPLHHRNSLAGSVHPATLYMPKTGPSFVVVTFSNRRWETPVHLVDGVDRSSTRTGVTPCYVEFRGEDVARIYAKEDAPEHFALIPMGQFWTHST